MGDWKPRATAPLETGRPSWWRGMSQTLVAVVIALVVVLVAFAALVAYNT